MHVSKTKSTTKAKAAPSSVTHYKGLGKRNDRHEDEPARTPKKRRTCRKPADDDDSPGDDDGYEDPGDEDDATVDDDDNSGRDLRVCNVTLRQIIRQDLGHHAGTIQGLLEEAQTNVTNHDHEMSMIALKVAHLVASGNLLSKTPMDFDMNTILPEEHLVDEDDAHINVAPINGNLMASIEKWTDDKTPLSVRDNDLTNILSYEHIRHLHTHVLSERCRRLASSQMDQG